MPDRDVKTIQDLIYYQYAKIVAKSAFSLTDGEKAKKYHYGFIKKTFKELKAGSKSWSDICREDWQLVETNKHCIYCGNIENLQKEHIVPRSLHFNERCQKCDVIQSIHNQVWACKKCNFAKGNKGLYKYFSTILNREDFFDFIPPLIEKKYLKTIYRCHDCAGTLYSGDIDGDGELSVFDIDFIINSKKYCV